LQIRDKVEAQAMSDADLLFVDWSNRQPKLWLSNLYTVTLTQGTATYKLRLLTRT